jgi:hypothetical protein
MPGAAKVREASVSKAILARLSRGPMVASVLYKDLEQAGYTKSNAKSAVSRLASKGEITRGGLLLGRGNTILFSGTPSASPELLKRLVEEEFHGREPLSWLVQCLRSSHPAVTRYDVAKLAALEIGRPEVPDWHETNGVIDGLVELGVLSPAQVFGPAEAWEGNKTLIKAAGLSFSRTNLNASFLAMRERVRVGVAASMADWLEKNSFAGTKTAKHGTPESPGVNYLGLPFDILAFTFVSGIVEREGGTAGRALVGDVLLDQCNLAYAKSFIHRVRQCASKQKQWPLHFVLAKGFDRDAFNYLREQGSLVWHQSQLLGQKTADAIQRTLTLVESLVRKQDLDPGLLALVFDGLENYESLFGNLKGKLFEILVGYLLQKVGYETWLGWQIAEGKEEYDVDVVGRRGRELVFAECKGGGAKSIVSETQVKRHFTKRSPLARSKALEDAIRRPTTFRSLVVTSGTIEASAVHNFDSGAYPHKTDTQLELWDRPRLLAELEAADLPDLIAVVQRYFSD